MAISYTESRKLIAKLVKAGTPAEQAEGLVVIMHGKIKELSQAEKLGQAIKDKPAEERVNMLSALVNEANNNLAFKYGFVVNKWAHSGKWDKISTVLRVGGKTSIVNKYMPTDEQLLSTWSFIGLDSFVEYYEAYSKLTTYAPLKEELRAENCQLPNSRASIEAPLS